MPCWRSPSRFRQQASPAAAMLTASGAEIAGLRADLRRRLADAALRTVAG
jgi:hypothetical protein